MCKCIYKNLVYISNGLYRRYRYYNILYTSRRRRGKRVRLHRDTTDTMSRVNYKE